MTSLDPTSEGNRTRHTSGRTNLRIPPAINGQLRFVHYTTAQAALNIIKSKRMWMRNAMCMSDYREVLHGYKILLKFFDKPKTEVFATALDKRAPGAAMEAISQFNQWWNNIQFSTYIASISEHDDNEDLRGRLFRYCQLILSKPENRNCKTP